MTDISDADAASAAYVLDLVRADVGRLRNLWRRPFAAIAWIDTWLGLIWDGEVKRETTLVVRRRLDGEVVVSYDYDYESDALIHRESLQLRLASMTVDEFEEDLGL